MLSTEKLEALSKFLAVLNELAKVSAMGVLALLAIGAIAAPTWVKGTFTALGLEIKELNAGPLKLVATETVKAGANAVQIAEALNQAELRLTDISVNAQKQPIAARDASAIGETLKKIVLARAALDEQASSIQNTGAAVGVSANPPSRGWLYLGLFGENGNLKLPSSRLEPNSGVRNIDGKPAELVLRFDAPVVSNGDDCTKTDVADFVPPNPNAPEQQYAILRASAEPLKILATKTCDAPGGNRITYAQIEVPRNRVRFAMLSSLPH